MLEAMATDQDSSPSRRALLQGLGWVTWAGLVASLGLGLGAALRLAGSGRGDEAAHPVTLGKASLLEPGQVLTLEGVAVARDGQGLYALSLVCPHLGCRPAWDQAGGRFLCPCHGSAFAADGRRLAGPARTGLNHLALDLDAQGRLVVDPRRTVAEQTRLRPDKA